ncbi:MAG: glycosyltransferase family 4 protein [Bacteroidetes bacterium]|nr:glycosyltransferase family 4 protein [Bacteroidota bacterium]
MGDQPLIAIFCNTFPPELSGASGRMYHLAVLLRNAGYSVQVICALPNYPGGKIFPQYRGRRMVDEVIDGIPVRRVALFPSNVSNILIRGFSQLSLVASMRLQAYRWLLKKKPALIITSSPPLPMAADVVYYFKKKGIKVLLNVSDIWPLSASTLGALSEGSVYRYLQHKERQMYAGAVAITAQSEASLRHIRASQPKIGPTFLYRNLPLPSPVEGNNDPPNTTRIIYPGVLGHAQGILKFCQNIPLSKLGIGLDIYGKGPEYGAIKKWLSQHPDLDIRLMEPVTPQDLVEVLGNYRAMLIHLNTEIEGAVPSKLFTAIAYGLPVLFNAGGEGAALVKQFQLGWVADPGDFSSIISNLKQMSRQSATEYRQHSQHIQSAALAHFNKAKQDATFLDFLEGIIEG